MGHAVFETFSFEAKSVTTEHFYTNVCLFISDFLLLLHPCVILLFYISVCLQDIVSLESKS